MQLFLNFLAVEPTPAYECDLYLALFFIIIITVILFNDYYSYYDIIHHYLYIYSNYACFLFVKMMFRVIICCLFLPFIFPTFCLKEIKSKYSISVGLKDFLPHALFTKRFLFYSILDLNTFVCEKRTASVKPTIIHY
jgi:hypothetical protein